MRKVNKVVIFWEGFRDGLCYYKEFEMEEEKTLKDVRMLLSSDGLVNFINCEDDVYGIGSDLEVLMFLGSFEEFKEYNKKKGYEERMSDYKDENSFEEWKVNFDINYYLKEVWDLFKLVMKRGEK